MHYNQLFDNIKKKKSFLCIGLDTDPARIPEFMLSLEDPVFEFNKRIIDTTHHFTIAYKPNIAFYERRGSSGWVSLERTVQYLKGKYPEIFLIADAKRGDIGNTSEMYAQAFFENLDFDAVTVAPYMGKDSISPFLSYHGKWIILLALTSNKGANDFQFIEDNQSQKRLFEVVLERSKSWGTKENIMFVVGATRAEMLEKIRRIVPDHFLLVPGIGAQGGSLQDVARFGMNKNCGLLVNSSRGIIYTDKSARFTEIAAQKAREIQQEMALILSEYHIV
jgi:orotidine-5'-phosphate decarboxylase